MIRLVKLSQEYRRQLTEMMDEWFASGEKIIPYAILKTDYRDFDSYLADIELDVETAAERGLVPDRTYFVLDDERNTFVGAVNIRLWLNESLLKNGGHIGDGIRPSERCKGFGTEAVRLALKECRRLGIDRVLMVCSKENAASRKTILRNGGVKENEVDDGEGGIDERYWIAQSGSDGN